MNEGETPTLTAELERKLELADSQLVIYARDLKRSVDAERAKAKELAEANARLKILDQLKSDFLSFISHELRTPLVGLSLVRALDCQKGRPELAEVLAAMQSSYGRLEAFVEKGLEYFSWLAVERVVTSETTDLLSVTHEVAESIPGLVTGAVDFRIDSSSGSYYVRGSREDLGLVVRILLENAIKFSPIEKRLRVKLNVALGEVSLAVADNGVGFPPEMAEEFFQPFTIGDVAHHSTGTGLNLALARAILKAHGGQLRGESLGSGRGATFLASLPSVYAHDGAIEESLGAYSRVFPGDP